MAKTREDALATVAAAVQITFEEYLGAYRRVRGREPFTYITRKMLAIEHGSNSISMASKFMAVIEAMEGDQPRRRAGARKTDAGTADGLAHLPEVEKALEATRNAFENLAKAFQAGRNIDRFALSEHCQALLAQQAAEFAVDKLAAEERESDLEAAASGSGDEAWDNRVAVDAALAAAAEAERDIVAEKLNDAVQKHELERVRMNSCTEGLERDLATCAEELSALKATANTLTSALSDLRAENAVLQERATALSELIVQQQALLAACEARHERDRDALEGELAGERERASKREADLLAWLGKQNRGADDGSVA